MEVRTISPEIATVLLENNTLNRPIKDKRVAFYARQMKEGKWKLNGETIIISKTGKLLEGQHRMWACVTAGVPFTTYVVEGVDEDAFDTINMGISRTNADVLYIAGYKNTHRLAGAVRTYKAYKDNNIQLIRSGGYNISGYEARELAAEYPGLVDILETIAGDKSLRAIVSIGLITALTYIFSEDDSYLAGIWINGIRTGEGLEAGSPILAARNRLISWSLNRPKPNILEYYTILVRSWNALIKGEKVQMLQSARKLQDGSYAYPKIEKKREAA